jgi:sulfoxide reductase catalytic subunit YedY
MFIKKNRFGELPESEVTDQSIYMSRRQFLNTAAIATTASTAALLPSISEAASNQAKPLEVAKKADFAAGEKVSTFEEITTYNNFYEFSTNKQTPALLAKDFPDMSKPWMISIEGECDKPGEYDYMELIKPFTLEERIYRFRCVEGWSMVIPWVGIPLAEVLKQAQPNSKAKYVEFTTLYDPEQMPGQRRPVLNWPYTEGLRIDEAMHPLTMLSVGIYGKTLLGQNGAPIRLVVPWKYGFKSIKSIVKIRFVEHMPDTSWKLAGPREYGFYSNVNPEVDHPRWSQARERRIGEFFKRETLMFNGYQDQVASLYANMDLKRNF